MSDIYSDRKPIMIKEEYDQIVQALKNKRATLFFKRVFDLVFALVLIVLLLPLMVVLSALIVLDSGLPVFFKQERMGKEGKTFQILKFRTMKKNSTTSHGITLANSDRITRVGGFLRKYRLDEIPQLFNVIKGEMSFVGPRPDLPKYYEVDDYGYKCVLLVKPGITGEATLKFKDEDMLLAMSDDPEMTYVKEIFPQKVILNTEYVMNSSFLYDFNLMISTLLYVFGNSVSDSKKLDM